MDYNHKSLFPTRCFVDPEIPIQDSHRDELGFLNASLSLGTTDIISVINRSPVLIIAPPWTGKTYVADGLFKGLQENRSEHPYGDYFDRRNLEQSGSIVSEPRWWQQWLRSDKPALLIVDSVDEGARNNNRSLHGLLDLIEQLDDKQRNRLRIVLFCRENERDESIEKRVEEMFPKGDDESPGFHALKLAPLTQLEAKSLVGDTDKFKRICSLIIENNLQQVAGLPKAIQALKSVSPGTSITVPGVWELVLRHALEDRHRTATDLGDRFNATSLIAATLQLSGKLHFATGYRTTALTTISDIFPDGRDHHEMKMREAAHEAIRSMVFVDDGTGIRFAQKHVQEWFAAFSMKNVDPDRIRGLLVGRDGKPHREHSGIIANLKACSNEEMRTRLSNFYSGLPPKSDTAPWSASESMKFIDQMLIHAENSPYAISFWRDEVDLSELSAHGLGEKLAARIQDTSLNAVQKELLVDIASAINSVEFTPAALELLKDDNNPDSIRKACAYFIENHPSKHSTQEIENFVDSFSPKDDNQNAIKSVLVRMLYEQGTWSHLQACTALPAKESSIGDATSMLTYRLTEDLNPQRARELLNKIDLVAWAEDNSKDKKQRKRIRSRKGFDELISESMSVLFKDGIADQDLDLLLPLAVRQVFAGKSHTYVTAVFQQSSAGRRILFEWRIRHSDSANSKFQFPWPHSMKASDLHWLEDALDKHSDSQPWIREFCIHVCKNKDVVIADKRRIRKKIRQVDKALVEEFDRRHKLSIARQKRYQKQEEKHKNESPTQHALADLVTERLSHTEWTPVDLMRELSSLCFPSHGMRYSNVDGEWEDLPADLKEQVYKAVQNGLQTGNPRAIPEGKTYSAGIVFEAEAFTHMINNAPSFTVTSDLVKKWLPAVLVTGSPSDETTIAACVGASDHDFVSVVVNEYRRQIRAGEEQPYLIENLPSVAWGSMLPKKVYDLIQDSSLASKTRGILLRTLANHDAGSTLNIADRWTQQAWNNDTRELNIAAIDVLLVLDPPRGISQLQHAVNTVRDLDTAQFICLTRHGRENWHINLSLCNGNSLNILYRLIRAQYPPSSDPDRESGETYSPNEYDWMSELKNKIISALLEHTDDNSEAINSLRRDFDDLDRTFSYYDAKSKITSTAIEIPTHDLPNVPVHDAVRALGNSDYWVIRDGEDLFKLITRELVKIEQQTGHHLSMLYEKPIRKKANGGSKISSKATRRKRLWEDALQAYVKCRLEDRLGHRTSNRSFEVSFARETLESRDQRTDVKCLATTFDNVHVCVIVEVKWSDNKDVSTSLSEQLGDRYLVGQNEKYGVYLVGLTYPSDTEPWKGRHSFSNKDDPEAWRSAMEKQAHDYMNSGKGNDVSIAVIVWNLWR